jgi:hypothetical protein
MTGKTQWQRRVCENRDEVSALTDKMRELDAENERERKELESKNKTGERRHKKGTRSEEENIFSPLEPLLPALIR